MNSKSKTQPKLKWMRPSEVPGYLHNTPFYKYLNLEDDDKFSIQANFVKQDLHVASYDDVSDLLDTVQFWGLNVFPEINLRFLQKEDGTTPAHYIVIALDNNNKPHVRMEAAMASGSIEVIRLVEQMLYLYAYDWNNLYTRHSLILAATKGNVECLHHALQQISTHESPQRKLYASDLFNSALVNGHLSCVKLLLEYGYSYK